jgi:hypothetical protein
VRATNRNETVVGSAKYPCGEIATSMDCGAGPTGRRLTTTIPEAPGAVISTVAVNAGGGVPPRSSPNTAAVGVGVTEVDCGVV